MEQESILHVYPFRACESEKRKEKLVTVIYKNNVPTFIEKVLDKLFKIKPKEKTHKIDLDDIGTFIWNLCDGKRNVDEITQKTREYFKDKVEPAEERVQEFIRQLHRTKLINLYEKKS